MGRLHLSPIVKEVFECLESNRDDREGLIKCIREVCDKERRLLLGFYTALLMKSYGLDRDGEENGPFIQVGPIDGVFTMCIGCLKDECRSFIEDIAEFVEGFPGVVAAVVTCDGSKLCVETITWDRVRRELL